VLEIIFNVETILEKFDQCLQYIFYFLGFLFTFVFSRSVSTGALKELKVLKEVKVLDK